MKIISTQVIHAQVLNDMTLVCKLLELKPQKP